MRHRRVRGRLRRLRCALRGGHVYEISAMKAMGTLVLLGVQCPTCGWSVPWRPEVGRRTTADALAWIREQGR